MHKRRHDVQLSTSATSGLGSLFSSGDAINLLEIIHQSLSCNVKEDFQALFPKIRELLPYEFAFAMLGHHIENKGMVSSFTANISFPEEWIREYVSRNYLQADSVILENFKKYEVQNWTTTRKDLQRKKEISSLCNDFGLRECITHGSRPKTLEINGSMFCFSGSSIKLNGRKAAILEVLIPHLHLTLSNIHNRHNVKKLDIHLSAREKEVLNWLKHGKSSWDISVILGISERTVNFHVCNSMQKLDAINRPQAVAVATRMGLIDIG